MVVKEIKNNDKPKVLILAGIHGDELTSMEVCDSLFYKCVDENYKAANIKFINYVNWYGIKNCVRECYSEEKIEDLNRAHYVENDSVREILHDEIDKCDIMIDLHSSPKMMESFLIDNGTKFNLSLFSKYNIPIIVRNFDGQTLKNYALNKNKIGLTFEANGLREVDYDSVDRSVNIIFKILNNINEFKDDLLIKDSFRLSYDKLYRNEFSPFTGIIKNKNSVLGKFLLKDDDVFLIQDPHNIKNTAIIKMPTDGYVTNVVDKDFVNADDYLFSIQPLIFN